jgi:pimeloyl-ACP methyl ester carboxylesterase
VVGDALYVLDHIENLNDGNSLFEDRLNLDQIGMYGHSFGGAATLEVMKQDARVKAGLTLDGAIGSDLIPESFENPLLLMLAEESFAENSSNQLFNKTGDDGYLLTIMGSTHYAFTDVGLLMSHFIPLIPPDLLLFGTINAKRMVNITRNYIREFFDVYLKDEPMEDLLDLRMVFEEAILVTK